MQESKLNVFFKQFTRQVTLSLLVLIILSVSLFDTREQLLYSTVVFLLFDIVWSAGFVKGRFDERN